MAWTARGKMGNNAPSSPHRSQHSIMHCFVAAARGSSGGLVSAPEAVFEPRGTRRPFLSPGGCWARSQSLPLRRRRHRRVLPVAIGSAWLEPAIANAGNSPQMPPRGAQLLAAAEAEAAARQHPSRPLRLRWRPRVRRQREPRVHCRCGSWVSFRPTRSGQARRGGWPPSSALWAPQAQGTSRVCPPRTSRRCGRR